ncbi:MAG TPA: iron ABC transporter permease [Alphaproteobacteria bacterium]|nr:iron ABC transporter permease [Alphaproteobacteria bacterium]
MSLFGTTADGAFRARGFVDWRSALQYAIPALGAIFTVLLVLVPLVTLVVFSFRQGTPWQPGNFTFRNYVIAYSNSLTYTMFVNTAALAALSTALSTVIAVFFAYLTERTDMPFRNVAWGLMLVPMAIPGLLFAMSWTFLLSPNIGLFNVMIRDVLSLFMDPGTRGPFNVYSLGGMVVLEGLRGVTTTFLIMVGAFRAMDPNLEEAARTAGANGRVTFFRVFLPLLLPAILAASMYGFMTHLESLEIPLVIGLPAKIYVFPSYIYFTTQLASPPQFGLSASLGASFMLVSILLVFWYRRLVGKAGKYTTITGKGYRPRLAKLGRWRYLCFSIFLIYFVLVIGAPVFVLAWSSFLPIYMNPSWELLPDLTFMHYRAIFNESGIGAATWNTIFVGIVAATLTMVLSLLCAWLISRRQASGKAILDVVTFLPHSLPGVIVGIALMFVFIQPPLSSLGLFGSTWLIAIGLTIGYIAFGSRTMIGAFAQLHTEMEEAGRTSGARWGVIIRRIVLPLLLPSFISGWIWVASHSLRNFSVPLMLSTRDSQVLSVIMWHSWADGYPGQTAALGMLLIIGLAVLTIGGRMLMSRFSRQQET